MKNARFESLGLYLPERVVSSDEVIERMQVKPLYGLREITGIQSRRVCAENEDSLVLAVNAAEDCLRNSKYQAADLDIIISTSITRFLPNRIFKMDPALSLDIKRALGAHQAINYDITNACAGMITGAYILNSLIKSGAVRNGMVVSGEYITPIAETAIRECSEPLDIQFASLTVGDSGAAFIMDTASDENDCIDFVDMMTAAEHAELCIGMPSAEGAGVAMYTQSKKMHEQHPLIPTFIEKTFTKYDRRFQSEQYDYLITHQVAVSTTKGIKLLLRKHFKEAMPETLSCVEEFGNPSSTAHFIVLYNALKSGAITKGKRVLLVPSASGMVFGCLSTMLGDLRV